MKTLAQLLQQDLKGKRVLVRCDLNVPFDQKNRVVLDSTRIIQHKKTIDALVAAGAKVILLSHFGRPEGENINAFSLTHILPQVREVLGYQIEFISSPIGAAAYWTIDNSRCPVLLAENTRFYKSEAINRDTYAKKLSLCGDYFVNDAFSVAHRSHASILGVAQCLPSYAGLALEAEVKGMDKYLQDPKRPSLAIMGGSKIAGKASVLKKVLPQMDVVAIGGAMANAFLVAQGKMTLAVDREAVKIAGEVLSAAQDSGTKILLPVDMVCAKKLAEGVETQTYTLADIPAGLGCFDIGAASIAQIETAIKAAETILWNGPLGAFEIKPFDQSSLAIAKAVAATESLSVAGGGETLTTIHLAGAQDGWTHLSTAGGAFLTRLQGEPMPALDVLDL